ncbi:MAG: hypothetical protein HPY76_11505 [Anaerolineae bacterium]|nr:hypothetical protein [Anaerolineae bacterium]
MDRGRIFVAALLLVTGVVLLAGNLLPGWANLVSWTVIFFILALGFFLPAAIWRDQRRGLAGMFIPGAIMLVLGAIFTYNVASGDWAAWSYLWTLVPASVGLGLALASWVGGWGESTAWVGIIMMAVSLALFALMASLMGNPVMGTVAPLLLILLGLVLLVRALRRPRTDA